MTPPSAPSSASGPGRALVAVYGVLALAATARSAVQVVTDWTAAPLAYGLSALAAVIYLVATVALGSGRAGLRPVAWAAVGVEAVGVLAVGGLSLARPELFADATVWSAFGQGYGYVPLVLPWLGLWWLVRTSPARDRPAR